MQRFLSQHQLLLAYEFPALAGVEGVLGTTEADLTRARNGMGREFDKIRDQMAILRDDLQQNPGRALMMDAVVQQVLTAKNAAGKPEYTPQEQQRFRAWTQGQVESQRFASQATAAGGGLLFLGSLYPPIALTPVGHGLRVAATAAGFGAAALEMPNLLTMHAAAQSQRGGSGEFTAQSPNEAQFNLMMGRVNLMLAAGDVLVETGALPAMMRGMKQLAARGVQVTRETWSAGMKAKRAGTFEQWLLGLPADQRQEMRAALEGVPTQQMEARGNTRGSGKPQGGSEQFWERATNYKWETYERLGAEEQKIAGRMYDVFLQRFISPGVGQPIHTIRNVRNLGDGLYEIKHSSGVRVYLDVNGKRLGFSNKNNQDQVIRRLKESLKEPQP
jgi:hypothetical protein